MGASHGSCAAKGMRAVFFGRHAGPWQRLAVRQKWLPWLPASVPWRPRACWHVLFIVVLSVREEALVRGFVDKYKLWGGDKRPRPSPTDALRKESGESGGSFIPARLCEE